MAIKKKFTPLTDAEIEIAAAALNRTWETVAHDTLALGEGKPLKRKDMVGVTIDYVEMYGSLTALGKVLFRRNDIYLALLAVLPKLFPFKTYGY